MSHVMGNTAPRFDAMPATSPAVVAELAAHGDATAAALLERANAAFDAKLSAHSPDATPLRMEEIEAMRKHFVLGWLEMAAEMTAEIAASAAPSSATPALVPTTPEELKKERTAALKSFCRAAARVREANEPDGDTALVVALLEFFVREDGLLGFVKARELSERLGARASGLTGSP